MVTKEKRKQERCEIKDVLEVFDIHSERQLGRVVDISAEGLMIISKNPVPVNQIFQLLIPLPMELVGCNELRLGAESLWTRETDSGTEHWAGFHIISIADEYCHCIQEVLSNA